MGNTTGEKQSPIRGNVRESTHLTNNAKRVDGESAHLHTLNRIFFNVIVSVPLRNQTTDLNIVDIRAVQRQKHVRET